MLQLCTSDFSPSSMYTVAAVCYWHGCLWILSSLYSLLHIATEMCVCVCMCVLLSGQIMILHIFSQMHTSNNKSPHLCQGLCAFWGMLSILSQNFYSVLAFISYIHRALTLARGETLGLYQVFRIHTATRMCIGLYMHRSIYAHSLLYSHKYSRIF